MLNISGIFPPVPTAFENNDQLALDKYQGNLKRLSQYDLAGFLILGSNGEMVMLSGEEKRQIFVAAREAIPSDKIMLAGTGMQSTVETIRLSKMAEKSGADAVLVLNPSYFKGLFTKEALVNHYYKVADAMQIPVIMYNMPGCSGVDMGADIIIECSQHENIIGLKDSGGYVAKMGEILEGAKPGFQILAGGAGFLLPALSIGAVGGILALANIAPQQCLDILKYFKAGEMSKARELQHKMIPVANAVTRDGGMPALKAAMDHLGMYGGNCRQPIMTISKEKKSRLVELLDKYEIGIN